MPRKDLLFIDVYFTGPGGKHQKERWEEKAKREKMSRSSFIREAVECYLKQADAPQVPREAIQLREENRKLREELKLRVMAQEKAETDIFRMQNSAFLGEPRGKIHLDDNLVALLRTRPFWKADQLLDALGLNPRDADAIRIVSKQLQILAAVGVISETGRGWKWVA
jgi:hypothetical protein